MSQFTSVTIFDRFALWFFLTFCNFKVGWLNFFLQREQKEEEAEEQEEKSGGKFMNQFDRPTDPSQSNISHPIVPLSSPWPLKVFQVNQQITPGILIGFLFFFFSKLDLWFWQSLLTTLGAESYKNHNLFLLLSLAVYWCSIPHPTYSLRQRWKKRQAWQARLCYFFSQNCANFWPVYAQNLLLAWASRTGRRLFN